MALQLLINQVFKDDSFFITPGPEKIKVAPEILFAFQYNFSWQFSFEWLAPLAVKAISGKYYHAGSWRYHKLYIWIQDFDRISISTSVEYQY